jgi:hypothetical protein
MNGKKVSEKISGTISEKLSNITSHIFGGVKEGILNFFNNKESWGRKVLDSLVKVERFITGELVTDPYIAKNYPLSFFTHLRTNLLRLSAQKEAEKNIANIFSVLSDKDGKEAGNRAREVLAFQDSLNRLLFKFFNYYALEKENLPALIEEIKRKRTFLDDEQIQALRNIWNDFRTKRKVIEMESGEPLTIDKIYGKTKAFQLAKDKGYVSEVEKIFRDIMGEPNLKLEDVYFPLISPEYYLKRYGIEKLHPIMPKKVMKMKGFYEKPRTIDPSESVWATFEDPFEAYKFFQESFYFTREFNDIMLQALSHYDLFRRMTKEEIVKLMEYIGDRTHGRFIKREELEKIGLKSLVDKLTPDEDGILIYNFSPQGFQDRFTKLERFIFDLIAGGLTDRELAQLGITRQTFIIPNKYGRWLEKMLQGYGGLYRFSPELAEIFDKIRLFTTFWKKLVTIYLGGVPFQTMNAIGDVWRLASFHPEALSKLREAAELMSAYLGRNLDKLKAKYTPEQLERRLKIIEEVAHSYVDFITDAKTPYLRSLFKETNDLGVFNVFRTIDDFLQRVYEGREGVTKLASALYNIERVERGFAPVFRGAPDYILEMYRQGYIYEAIGAYGRHITVDYAAMNPTFKAVFSNFLTPFAFWYVRNFKSLIDLSIKTKGIVPAFAYILPLVVMTFFNYHPNDKKAREYEENLPDWVKYSLHFNIKANSFLKKIFNLKQDYFTIAFQSPWEIAASFFGIEKIWALFDDWRNKKISDEFFRDKVIEEITGGAITRQFRNLMNPVLKAFVDINANRNSFTGRKIVRDELLGTPQAKQIQVAYFLSQLSLTPIIPLMGITNSADIDFLLRDVDRRGLDSGWKTAIRVMWETIRKGYLDEGFKRALQIRDWDYSNFLMRSFYEEVTPRQKSFIDYAERTLNAFLKGNYEEFQRRIEDVRLGKVPSVTIDMLNNYFNRPTTVERIISNFAQKKLPPEMKEKVDALITINQLRRRLQQLNKGFRNQAIDSIQDYLESLKEQ